MGFHVITIAVLHFMRYCHHNRMLKGGGFLGRWLQEMAYAGLKVLKLRN